MSRASPTEREGRRTVRESEATVREHQAAVREAGATVREAGATVREGVGQSPPSVARSQEEQVAGWLPGSLAADFRMIESLPAQGGEADLYVLEPRNTSRGGDSGARRVAKVYRHGIAPKEDVIRRVQAADPAHVVRLEAYGRDGGRWWELMEYVERGSLRALIEQEGPKLPSNLVREILQQLNEALAGLHALPLEHRDLKPANVLVRSRTPLNLIVTDFGISSLMNASQHFTLAARTVKYAPPESLGTTVMIEHTKWDYWSLGMMLVEMLQGAHPHEGLAEPVISNQLLTQNVDRLTEGISAPVWRKLCRGLLRRTPSTRWDSEAVSKWIADPYDPSLVVAKDSTAAPDQAQIPANATISFNGARFATPEDLGAALAKDWGKAESFWKRRFSDVHTWVIDRLGRGALGDALAALDDADLPLESQVFSFIYHLAPNAPVRFRDTDLTVERLAELGQQAANGGDMTARSALLSLYGLRILALAARLPGGEELGEVSRRWDEAVGDYGRIRSEVRGRGLAVTAQDEDMLVRLLAASIPGCPFLAALRVQAHKASTADARRSRWFRELGTPEDMPVAVLCMLPQLVVPARTEGRLARMQGVRGCLAGIVVGGLFGGLVLWGDRQGTYGGIGGNFDGAALLAAVMIALYLAIPWYRAGIRGVGDRLRGLRQPLGRVRDRLRRAGRWLAQRNDERLQARHRRLQAERERLQAERERLQPDWRRPPGRPFPRTHSHHRNPRRRASRFEPRSWDDTDR